MSAGDSRPRTPRSGRTLRPGELAALPLAARRAVVARLVARPFFLQEEAAVSRVIDTRDLFIANALGALAVLTRQELEMLVEPGSTIDVTARETGLSRADLAAHLAAELADATLQALQGHR